MSYGRNYRPFADALRRALAHWEDPDGKARKAIDVIAGKIVQAATEGERDAAVEIANRLDGKPHQSIDATVAHGDAYEQLTDTELQERIASLQLRLAKDAAAGSGRAN